MKEAQIQIRRRGDRTRVYAAVGGKDVSHLSYAPQQFQIGPAARVRMAGIGGVGTEPEFRRRGLAYRVFSRAMEEIRGAGYSCVGLYTGKEIVAHRLYRLFGFVDVRVPQPAMKLLDPAAFAARKLSQALATSAAGEEELANWRCALELCLPPDPLFYLQIEHSHARALDHPPRKLDLSLVTSRSVLMRLLWGSLTPQFAEAGGLLHWRGDPAHWRRLSATLAARHRVIIEGST